ncbi:MAG: nucleotidyltransferase [Enterobacteriaceae bacterium]|nr:nucleotidyltransferase [Enterobacteriaceae bacterium]
MSTNDYLKNVLASHNLKNDAEEIEKVREERSNVEKIIKDKYPDAKKTIRYGGSYAKDTMIKDNYDLDILCYFHEGENAAGESLEEIYNNIKKCLDDSYYIQTKRSALRLKNKEDKNDFHIDVVPGRFVEKDNGDAYLYQEGAEKSRLKTNPDKHIDYIKNSKLIDIIKLLKIWGNKNGVEIKTFVLELLTVKVLIDRKDKSLSENLKYFWEEMKDNIDNIAIEDPANPNNDLSDIFNDSVKQSIKLIAEIALGNIENDEWENIFGQIEDNDSDDKDNEEKKRKIESFASSAGVVAKPYAEQ